MLNKWQIKAVNLNTAIQLYLQGHMTKADYDKTVKEIMK